MPQCCRLYDMCTGHMGIQPSSQWSPPTPGGQDPSTSDATAAAVDAGATDKWIRSARSVIAQARAQSKNPKIRWKDRLTSRSENRDDGISPDSGNDPGGSSANPSPDAGSSSDSSGTGGNSPPVLVYFPPRPNCQGSPNVFVNNLPAHRQGDKWLPHPHDSILCKGSPTVYTNGRQQGRVGDPVCCGSTVMTGSLNVFVGP